MIWRGEGDDGHSFAARSLTLRKAGPPAVEARLRGKGSIQAREKVLSMSDIAQELQAQAQDRSSRLKRGDFTRLLTDVNLMAGLSRVGIHIAGSEQLPSRPERSKGLALSMQA